MKTLYVSDLDGTLLRTNQKTSDFTNKIINELVEEGLLFSYATARSYNTSHKVTEGMTADFPLIVYNGVFVRDNASGEMLLKNFFDEEIKEVVLELIEYDLSPIVYAYVDGVERFTFNIDEVNDATLEFALTRENDSRYRPIKSLEELIAGEIFYLTLIDDESKLKPFYDKYKDKYHCFFQKDMYTGNQWLEIIPKNASKANAIKQLKDMLNCDRLVVFGDGVNDIDMFEIADEAYAVENAVDELKEIATGVIACNDEDGVAKWLYERVKGESIK